jgi:hypothetical protein
MYFSYQSDKLKGLQMPAIGPVVVAARAACEANIDGVHYLLTGHQSNGFVYLEDVGVTSPTDYTAYLTASASTEGDGKATAYVSPGIGNVKITPFIRTRKFYPANMDRDGYGEKVYLLFSTYGATGSATVTLVAGSTAMTGTGFDTNFLGNRVTGTGLDPGTIIIALVSSAEVTLSRAANTSFTGSVQFDNGTLSIGVRGSSLGEAVRGLRTDYVSTIVGDLASVVNSNFRRSFELQVEKVPLTFDANGDSATWVDLRTNMRLHSISYILTSTGLPDSNRNAS